jgi:2,2-dialkylglycine decarboxylase (pyruvate)
MPNREETAHLSNKADHVQTHSDAHDGGAQQTARASASAATRHTRHVGDDRAELLIRYVREFAPFLVRRAQGSWIETVEGDKILDFASGQICSTIGHNHPAVVAGLQRAARDAIHLDSKMISEPVLDLAARLVELLPDSLSKVIFVNTGSESNEIALKMARMATGRFEVAGLARSFHGVLTGIGSLTFLRSHAGYGPLLGGTFALPAPYSYRCPIRHCNGGCDCTCLDAGFELLDQQSVGALAAFIVEPVLSSGGIIVPPAGYLGRLQELCAEREMLLIVDEAQTGFGRLGAMFGFEIDGIVPDFITLSKSFGGGIPLAATATTSAIEDICYERGFSHLTSHVSDPLPAAVGNVVLQEITPQLISRVRVASERLMRGLRELEATFEQVGEVRGRGLLAGVEFVTDGSTRQPDPVLAANVTREALGAGLTVHLIPTGNSANCLRIAPPLSVTDAEIDFALDVLEAAIRTATGAAVSSPSASEGVAT